MFVNYDIIYIIDGGMQWLLKQLLNYQKKY